MAQSRISVGTETLTRQELYEAVWQSPLSRLAERFGLKGGQLASICHKNFVPYPAPGYWQKVAAGKKVTHVPLPELSDGVPKREGERSRKAAPPKAIAVDKIETTLEQKEYSPPSNPHRAIAVWTAENKRQEAERKRDGWGWFTPWTNNDHRKHRILDAIFKGVEKRGVAVLIGEYRQVHFEALGEQIHYATRYKKKQIRRPPTVEEMSRSSWRGGKYVQELKETNIFVFSIKTYQVAQEWIEGPETPFEDYIPEIIDCIAAAAPKLIAHKKAAAEAEAVRRQQEQERQAEADRRRRERNRFRRFVEFANRSNEAAIARAFLEKLIVQGDELDTEIGGRTADQWYGWLRDQVDAYDPLNAGPRAVLQNLANVTTWEYRD